MSSQFLKRTIVAPLMLVMFFMTCTAAQAQTNFGKDVNDAIDAWLAYARANGAYTSGAYNSVGLPLLAMLEKHADAFFNTPPNGYANSSAGDKCIERNVVAQIIQSHVPAGFYAYRNGIDLLALSEYANTGGPNPNSVLDACPVAFVPSGIQENVGAAIDSLVDQTLTAQDVSATGTGSQGGFWGYSGPGDDSSTTQFAAGGLAAALSFYNANVPASPRIALINAALALTRAGYAANMQVESGAAADRGWEYRPPHPCCGVSYQQTASGLWASQLGGATVNDASVQAGLHFQRDHYNYDNTGYAPSFWSSAYAYYLFSSSKAYSLLDAQIPAFGNIGTQDLGTLPASAPDGRITRRNPLTDGCARTNFLGSCNGGVGPGEYSVESPRWYYDFAYRIMNLQNAGGDYAFPFGYGVGGDFWSENAYLTLVLERSLGGVNSPPNCTTATTTTPEVTPDVAHSYANITFGGVHDNDGDTLTYTVTGIRADECSEFSDPTNCAGASNTFNFPAIITGGGTGNAASDANVSGLVQVRRERNGSRSAPGNGRVYHIQFGVTDGHGGSCTGDVKVGVRFNATLAPVDGGTGFDATKK